MHVHFAWPINIPPYTLEAQPDLGIPGHQILLPYHQQHNILQKTSYDSWCLESICFPIQAAMKPWIKHVAKLILAHMTTVRNRSHELMEWLAQYRRSLRALCSHRTYKTMLVYAWMCSLSIVYGSYNGVNLKYDLWPRTIWTRIVRDE